MGKVRIKTLGDEELEKEEKKKSKQKKEAKQAAKTFEEKNEDEIVAQPVEGIKQEKKEKEKKEIKKKTSKKKLSKRYLSAKMLVEKKAYSIPQALDLLKKLQKAKFDETVELHVNTIETGISGNLTLPHGTGKKTRVAIADDKLIAEVEKGKIDFDILVAEPQMMPKLAKVAKILGPKGLMPNPKNGTVTSEPEKMIKKYEGGQINFKTEAKSPIIHLSVGKISFGNEKLAENIKVALEAVKKQNIKKAVLKSTMSPGIKLQI